MFGYVRPVQAKFSPQEQELYQAVYCGLCHEMGKKYGFLTRFTLTYDFTFLALLLAPVGEKTRICQKRCPAHPFRRKRGCVCFAGLETAADESLILTWHKLRDDVEDNGFFKGLPARISSFMLKHAYQKAAAQQRQFDERVRECLAQLHRLEELNCASIDRTADTFAAILEASAPSNGGESRDRVLAQLLYHVGRWIYLADAWDDLKEDRAHHHYNPLELRFEGNPEAHLEELRTTMTHSLRMSISAYHLADFGVWGGIIENILYFGLPTVQEAVLTGKWRQRQKNKEKDK